MFMISLLFSFIPIIIFLLGWLKLAFSLPIVALIIFTLLRLNVFLNQRPTSHWRLKKSYLIQVITLALIVTVLSGIGGFVTQDGDYLKHNAFFKDLSEQAWPLAYEHAGLNDARKILSTYICYYLPSTLVAKATNLNVAYYFSFLWGFFGITLFLLWLSKLINKQNILYPILFLLFGELALIGWNIFLPEYDLFGKHFYYANWMYYQSLNSPISNGLFWTLGSNFIFLATGPHHVIPAWIIIAIIFEQLLISKRYSLIPVLFSILPFYSIFLTIGVLPFLIYAFISSRNKLEFFNWTFFLAVILLLVSVLFLSGNQQSFEKGFIGNFVDFDFALKQILIFSALSWLPLCIILLYGLRREEDSEIRNLIFLSGGFIFLSSFYRLGYYMDFPIKSYNPSWLFLQIAVFILLGRTSIFHKPIIGMLLLAYISISSFGTLSALSYVSKTGLRQGGFDPIWTRHINQIGPWEKADAIFSKGDSFFWRYLAKEPVYFDVARE